MKSKKLDVLVTFYNQEKYVDRALESVFSQKCNFDFNVLIGDDGSTDDTLERINEWMERFPDIIEVYSMPREENKKYIGGFRASQNRLNLLKNVSSEYFIFLDGDDFFSEEDKLQLQIDILDNPQNFDCSGCSHSIDALYPDGTIKTYNIMRIREGKYSIKQYWSELYFHTDCTVIRSSVIPYINAELLKNNFNDNLITYSVMQKGKIYFIPRSMAVYDQTGDGIWTGEKAIVNNIRNIFLYDLCIQINSKYRYQSDIRFYECWKSLFTMRQDIDKEKMPELLEEAEEKKLKYSILWMNYNNSSSIKKIHVYLVFIRMSIERFAYKVSHLIKKIFRVGLRIFTSTIKKIRIQSLWKKENYVEDEESKVDVLDINAITYGNELNLKIAPVYNNRNGIVTIISDDGDYETSIILNKLAEESGIPITVAGYVGNIAAHLKYWKDIILEGNIELVNHSYNHCRMDDKWKYHKNKNKFIHEIVHSRIFFERQLGIKEKVFVCPENAINDLGYKVLREDGVVAVRRGTRGLNSLDIEDGTEPGNWLNLMCRGIMDQPEQNDSRRNMRQEWLEETAEGKWLIEMWHNVGTDGYQTIDLKSAREHIEDIKRFRDDRNLWCAKFTDAVRYLRERKTAVIHSWNENNREMLYISVEEIPSEKFHKLSLIRENDTNILNVLPNKLYVIQGNQVIEEHQ